MKTRSCRVIAGLGGEPAHRTAQLSRAQLQRHDHLGRLEVPFGDGDSAQVWEALECSGDTHGIGLLGSFGFVTVRSNFHRGAGRPCVVAREHANDQDEACMRTSSLVSDFTGRHASDKCRAEPRLGTGLGKSDRPGSWGGLRETWLWEPD